MFGGARMFGRQTLCSAALLAAAVLLASAGPARPDFSGVWVVDPQRSQLAAWAKFDSTTITIEHKEPKFRFHRVSVKAGKADETTYDLTTDGAELMEKEGGGANTSKLFWDGDVLVFQALIVLADGRQATDVVRYTLRDGGKTFVAEEKFRGPVVKYDNLWVAGKKD
jgi:hypothetical protein